MSKDKAEAKAKRYVLEQLEENGYRNFYGGECVEDAFTAGYTQAVTDLNSENEKLREALQSMFELVDVARSDNQEVRNQAFAKAKQLITEEK